MIVSHLQVPQRVWCDDSVTPAGPSEGVVWEPITGGKRAYTWSGNQSHEGREHISLTWNGNQSHEGREHIPGVGTNHTREDSIYLEWEPIAGGKRAFTWCGSQLQEGREHLPGVGANHRREESIYLEWEPIAGGKRVYTWSGEDIPIRGGRRTTITGACKRWFRR